MTNKSLCAIVIVIAVCFNALLTKSESLDVFSTVSTPKGTKFELIMKRGNCRKVENFVVYSLQVSHLVLEMRILSNILAKKIDACEMVRTASH